MRFCKLLSMVNVSQSHKCVNIIKIKEKELSRTKIIIYEYIYSFSFSNDFITESKMYTNQSIVSYIRKTYI